MVKVKNNFGFKVVCQACKFPNTEDSQRHAIFLCKKTKNSIHSKKNVKYNDIFGNDCKKLLNFIKVAEMSLRKREELLEKYQI